MKKNSNFIRSWILICYTFFKKTNISQKNIYQDNLKFQNIPLVTIKPIKIVELSLRHLSFLLLYAVLFSQDTFTQQLLDALEQMSSKLVTDFVQASYIVDKLNLILEARQRLLQNKLGETGSIRKNINDKNI